MLGKRILLVDDERCMYLVLKKMLEKEGFELLWVTSGQEAKELLDRENIDLILMDIQLNGSRDGIVTAEEILSERDIPLIFLTSHTEYNIVQRASRVSSYGYVVKDNGVGVLISSVKMALRLRNAYDRLKKLEEDTAEKQRILLLTEEFLGMGNYTASIPEQTWTSSAILDDIYGIDPDFPKTFAAWLGLVSDDQRAVVEKEFYDCIRERKKIDIVYKVIRPRDNQECWVHSVGDFDHLDKNRLIGTVLNITKRKVFEKALAESEANYRTLLNASPEGIVVMDLMGNITDVSTIALDLFEVKSAESVVGKPFFEFLLPADIPDFRKLLKTTIAEGLVQNVERRLRRKNSVTFPCEISTTLVQEKSGKAKAFMAIIRDISERKKLEQQMIHTERMISLGEMAAGIAHEINQPLNNISLSLENILYMLNSGDINTKYITAKSTNIFNGINRIQSIIEYIRAYARKQDDFISAPFDINNCIRFVTMLISEQLEKHRIEVCLELHQEPMIITGNTFKFEQVLLNLLSNAKDAIEEKIARNKVYEDREIHIRSWQHDGHYLTRIRDTGIGISKGQLEKIMLPFYTTKPLGKGTGLGLPMAFKIINEMKGRMEITSDEAEGTEILLWVPVKSVKT